MSSTLAEIKQAVRLIVEEQALRIKEWHKAEPSDLPIPEPKADIDVMVALGAANNQANYRLWHVEDEARRRDVGDDVIADCKRRIDGLNQKRNDLIEKVDACLVGLVGPLLPEEGEGRFNTETVGSAVDRLSIINLKIYHMREQTERGDVDEAHLQSCRDKLAVLQEQRADLLQSALELLDDYVAGAKRPKVYYQFKMYNDPKLNPSLYQGKAKA